MVAVALSAEVRPLPMAQQQPVQEDQVGGTPVTSTGIDSVDDHIARLKANARQHVNAQVQADSQPRAGGGKTPYLPSKEIAKTIKCRFFPNCYYADKCMFFHPTSMENAIPYFNPSSNVGSNAHAPIFEPAHVNGNGQQHHASSNGLASPSANNGEMPLSPSSNGMMNGEEYGNAYDMAYAPQSQQNGAPQQIYYMPTGYEGTPEQYNPYAPAQMYAAPPQQTSHQHSNSHSQTNNSQQSSQQQSQQSSQQSQYYGFVPYGPHGAYAYPAQGQYPGYYPQPNGYPGMYMPQQQQMHPHEDQQQMTNGHMSPVNGVVSPSSSSVAIPDPAIIAQSPESQSQENGPTSSSADQNGDKEEGQTSTSANMEKSSSAQSGKSTSSSKSKKSKKATATTAVSVETSAPSSNGVNGHSASPNGTVQALPTMLQNGEFVPPVPYYPMGVPMQLPGMPSEMMMMPPLPHHQHQHFPHQQQHFQHQHQQPQAYGSFSSPSNGQPAQLEPNGEKKGANGQHERTLSSSSGQMHTFFQTSGNTGDAPSRNAGSTATPSSSSATAAAAPARTNGTTPPSAMGGATTARFNPSSSTNGPMNVGVGKRFVPSAYATNGVILPRSGPVSGPGSLRRAPFDSNKPTLPCRYFETRSCRHGDLCHYTHLLIEERVIPNHPEGKLTRDARLLGLNIGSPDGRISDVSPKHPMEFGHANGASASLNGPRRHLQQSNGPSAAAQMQNGSHPNGFGMPHVNGKGRFVHPQQPSTQAFAAQQQQQHAQPQQQQAQQAAQQQQQQKEQQIAALANNNSADAQEKIQRLISETRNLPSSVPPPASTTATAAPRANGPRANGIPPSLGRRPPTGAHRNGNGPNGPSTAASHTSHQQRVPSGENDFPALSSSSPSSAAPPPASKAMEKSTSASSAAAAVEKKSTATESAKVASPAPSASVEAKKEDAPAQAQTQTTAPSQAQASAPAAASSTPAPAPAPAKPVAFSWASAAAKAASLPTPPPKRPVSKQRPSSNKEKESKGEKADKADKAEKADNKSQKETAKDAKKDTPAPTPTSAAPTAAAVVAAAAQAITAEAAPAPALKA